MILPVQESQEKSSQVISKNFLRSDYLRNWLIASLRYFKHLMTNSSSKDSMWNLIMSEFHLLKKFSKKSALKKSYWSSRRKKKNKVFLLKAIMKVVKLSHEGPVIITIIMKAVRLSQEGAARNTNSRNCKHLK